MARPVTFFKVGAPTASFRPAIEELDLSKAAVTEEAVLSNLGGAPPPNLVPEGTKVGVRMWNRTNSVMRVYITKEGETKRYCQELRPGMEAGWHSSPGQGFIVDGKSGLESQTTGHILITEEQAQQIVIVWGASTCPADVATHEELFGEAAKSLRKAEKRLFTELPPDQKIATKWLDAAKMQVAQVAVNDALVSELGEAEAQRVVAEFNKFLSDLQDVANAITQPVVTTLNTVNTYYTQPVQYYKPEHAGLYNQGATCYMNSLLQGLFFTPELRYALFKWRYDAERDPEKALCIPYQLQMLFCELQQNKERAAETEALTKSFGWAAGEQFQQQDATELFNMLTDALEKCFVGTRGEGIIKALYEGKQKDYIRCTECGYENSTEPTFTTLDIPIKPFGCPAIRSVEEGLESFFKAERLSDYTCEKCKAKSAEKGLGLSKVPYILTVNLKRFDYDWAQDARVKINDAVSFTEELNMAEFLEDGVSDEEEEEPEPAPAEAAGGGAAAADDGDLSLAPQRTSSRRNFGKDGGDILARGSSAVVDNVMPYELFVICIHAGGAHGGHYYAYVKDFKTGKWFEFNDARVSSLSNYDIKKAFGGVTPSYNYNRYAAQSSTSAYMLMYRRKDQPGQTQLNIDDVPDQIVPTYILTDQKAEEERKKLEEQRIHEEAQRKREEQQRRLNQFAIAVWHDLRLAVLRPEKADTWQAFQTAVCEEFGITTAPDDFRLILSTSDCPGGALGEAIDEEPLVPLKNMGGWPDGHPMLIVEEKAHGAAWPDAKYMLADATDETAVVAFTDVGDEDFKHQITLSKNTTLQDAATAIAEELSTEEAPVEADAFNLFDIGGKERQSGFACTMIAGSAEDYSSEKVLEAMAEVNRTGLAITAANVRAHLAAQSSAPAPFATDYYRQLNSIGVRVWNFSSEKVIVQRLTRGAYGSYDFFKYFATLEPGDEMVVGDDTMADRQLDVDTYRQNKSCFGTYCSERVTWRVMVGGVQNPLLNSQWNNPSDDKVHMFVEGQGSHVATLQQSRVMFTLHKNLWAGFKSGTGKKLAAGHHMVPIYKFLGRAYDFSEHVFDMEVDEDMLVSDFKAELAEKLHKDAGLLDDVDAGRLRVREITENWAGSVFMDADTILTSVDKFDGGEKFAFNVLDVGPEPKAAGQVVLSFFKFHPSKMALDDDYFELLVEPATTTADQLRAQVAELDPQIDSPDDVSLATTSQLCKGCYAADLTDTVWDMSQLKWDWDKSHTSMFSRAGDLAGAKDSNVYYYKDAQEQQMEMTAEEEQTLKKRSMIEKRKKQQAAKKSTSHRAETGVVMNVQARAQKDVAVEEGVPLDADAAGTSSATTTTPVPVVQSVAVQDGEEASSLPLARTISAGVRHELLQAEGKFSDAQLARLRQHDTARGGAGDDVRAREEWLRATSSREDFARARAQRDALRAMAEPPTVSEGEWVEVPGPTTLQELQAADIALEKQKVEAEVAELRRELGLHAGAEEER